MLRKRVAFVVKYFPLSRRISGLTSVIALLTHRLAKDFDVHVFAQCSPQQADEWSAASGATCHPVAGRYWLAVGKAVAEADCASVVLVSGISARRLIYPAFRLLVGRLGRSRRLLMYQGVNTDGPPGPLARRLLRRFDRVLCTSPRLLSLFGEPGVDGCRGCVADGVVVCEDFDWNTGHPAGGQDDQVVYAFQVWFDRCDSLAVQSVTLGVHIRVARVTNRYLRPNTFRELIVLGGPRSCVSASRQLDPGGAILVPNDARPVVTVRIK